MSNRSSGSSNRKSKQIMELHSEIDEQIEILKNEISKTGFGSNFPKDQSNESFVERLYQEGLIQEDLVRDLKEAMEKVLKDNEHGTESEEGDSTNQNHTDNHETKSSSSMCTEFSDKYLQMTEAGKRTLSANDDNPISYSSETHSNRVSSCFDVSCTSTTDDRTNELEKQISHLQSMCEALATENLKIKSNHKIVKEEKLKSLKRRNGELADIAEKMSQKARELYEKNVKKAQDITSLRTSLRKKKHDFEKYQMRRKSEHDQAVENLQQQLQVANSQIEDLKSKVEQTRRLKLAEMGIETKTYEDENVDLIRKKERLRMEKLVATSSNKIVVRSLSTPTTARQKILEEANRTLRRQLTDREVHIEEIEKEISRVQQVEESLQKADQQREQLSQELEQANNKISNLEAHLKTSTVAASDFDLQLNELRVVHAELQNDYNIVHDQLKLSIHERDQACERWIETSKKVEEMSAIIDEMKKEAKAFQTKENEIDLIHNKPNHTQKEEIIAPEYQQTLKLLQEKVNNLEEYCKKQENENTRLRSQLLALTSTSDSSEKDFANTNGKSEICDETSSLDQEMTNLVEAFSMKENCNVSNHVAVMGSLVGEGNQMNGVQQQSGDASCHISQPPHKVKRFVAKFSYDPLMGPNDNPEAELSLKAGDYVFVHGSMDDDGFYEGKLQDGSKGLVPSNYLEEIVATSSNNTICENSSSHLNGRSNSYDLTAEVMMGLLPFPRHLVVEKTLSHSLIIGWTCPLFNDRSDEVDEYHIYVNGSLSAVINGNKSKAVVENIYHDEKSYRIALCAITARGRSNPENCVITVGRDAYNCNLQEFRKLVDFKTDVITARSVTVTWKPVNSYSTYEIFLEKIDESVSASTSKDSEGGDVSDVVVRVEVAGYMTRHIIHHLKPDSKYRINISPKTSHLSNQPYESTPLEFTTANDNSLEAPTIVKVDESNKSLQSNHVTLSWLPNHKIGCKREQDQISSYLVFVNHQNAASVSSPSVHRCKINFTEISACIAHHLAKQRRQTTQVTSKQHETACSSPFTTLLDHVGISMMSVSKSGAKSPMSQSYFLHKNTVLAIKAHHQKSADTDDNDDGVDDQHNEVQQVVPAIEITQGTSSENSSDDDEVDPRRTFRLESPVSQDEMAASASKGSGTSSTIRRKSSGCSGASTSRQRFVRRNYSEDDSSSSHASVTMSPRLGMNHHQSSKLRSSSLSNFHGWVEDDRKHQRHHVKRSSSQHHHRKKSNGVHHHMRRKRPSSPRHNNSMLQFSDRSDGSDSSWYSSSPTLDHCFQKTLPGKNPEMRLSPVNNDFCSSAGNTLHSNKGLVVAIYHYDPYTMSPNADYLDEELPFEAGEPLVVFGAPGADGFYYGVKQNGKKGYIPSNMVSSVKVGEEDEIMSSFFKKSPDEVSSFFRKREGSRSFTNDAEEREVGKRNVKSSDISLLDTMLQDTTEERKHEEEVDKMKKGAVADDQISLTDNGKPLNNPRYFVALYDYDPNTSSPNIDIEVELSFHENDIIKVLGSLDVDGFYQGELNNRSGLVPCNFVQEIDDPDGHVVNLQKEKQHEQKNDNSSTISFEADDRETSKLSKPSPKSRPVVKQGPKNSKNVYKKTTIRQPAATVLHEPSMKRKSLLSKGKKLFRKLGETKSKK